MIDTSPWARLRAIQFYREHASLLDRALDILSRVAASRGRCIHCTQED